MSRSIFAMRFKEKVGTTPMECLTRWRMLLAGDRLTNSDDSLSKFQISLAMLRNPKVLSVKPSERSWAVLRGSIAGAEGGPLFHSE